jgi:hypothetical protein
MEAGVKVHASLFGINRLEDLTPILLHEFSIWRMRIGIMAQLA